MLRARAVCMPDGDNCYSVGETGGAVRAVSLGQIPQRPGADNLSTAALQTLSAGISMHDMASLVSPWVEVSLSAESTCTSETLASVLSSTASADVPRNSPIAANTAPQMQKRHKKPRQTPSFFTPKEDAMLCHLVQRVQPMGKRQGWATIAESLPGRSGQQCRERCVQRAPRHQHNGTCFITLCACRWVYKLMPADKTPLTSQQEAELFELAFRMAPTPQRVPWSRIVRSSSFRCKRCEQ